MPYNTRRKSLSLPSLGIQLPNASRAHRSNSKSTPISESTSPPSKRVKRVHESDLPPSSPSLILKPPQLRHADPAASRPPTQPVLQHTPPPSPGGAGSESKIDTDGINDDIVVAVIEQLEKTGNRPHLIRELATVLASSNDSVAQSANPAALLSSRLSLYLKRPWTALAPCPLAKELIPVHPRKVFFYLTTSPHQKMPETSHDILPPSSAHPKRLTPSLTPSVDPDDVEMEATERARVSLSPEVDLSSPDWHEADDHDHDHAMPPPTPGESFSGRSSLSRDDSLPDPKPGQHRAPSPPLEADEKGFTETATAVRARGANWNEAPVQSSVEPRNQPSSHGSPDSIDETAEMTHRKDQELGYELFGHAHATPAPPTHPNLLSSPMVVAGDAHAASVKKVTALVVDIDLRGGRDSSYDELTSPEHVALDELDGMFSNF